MPYIEFVLTNHGSLAANIKGNSWKCVMARNVLNAKQPIITAAAAAFDVMSEIKRDVAQSKK